MKDKHIFIHDENLSLSENMQIQFECETLNDDRHVFGQDDIAFQRCIEKVVLSQRDKDLMYITNFFYFAWKTIHIKYICHGEELNNYDFEITQNIFMALQRQDALDTFLHGLTKEELQDIIFK